MIVITNSLSTHSYLKICKVKELYVSKYELTEVYQEIHINSSFLLIFVHLYN